MSEVLDLLRSVGAIFTGDHFVYTSGKHGEVYINKDALYPHSGVTSQICALLAQQCAHLEVDVVAAPALGGIILSQWLSFHLSELKGKEICGVYAEKTADGGFVFTRGYDRFIQGKRVLVIEDLTTTGGSVKKTVEVVRATGGIVAGVCVLANRDPEKVTSSLFGAELIVGAEIPAQAWDAENCHLCQEGVPINTQMGHGKKFLSSQH